MQATSLTGDQMNIINFCMSAASLVGCVISLAMLSGPGTEDLYREYLGKLSCCHFSLVSMCTAVGLTLYINIPFPYLMYALVLVFTLL